MSWRAPAGLLAGGLMILILMDRPAAAAGTDMALDDCPRKLTSVRMAQEKERPDESDLVFPDFEIWEALEKQVTCLARFDLTPEGVPVNITLTCDHDDFESWAYAALRQSRFDPADAALLPPGARCGSNTLVFLPRSPVERATVRR